MLTHFDPGDVVIVPFPFTDKTGKIVTIDRRLVRKALRHLPASTFRRVRARVHRIV
jgi:hypothetical protein